MALGQGAGCSPFCGCASKQIAELIGDELRERFPEIKRAAGAAATQRRTLKESIEAQHAMVKMYREYRVPVERAGLFDLGHLDQSQFLSFRAKRGICFSERPKSRFFGLRPQNDNY